MGIPSRAGTSTAPDTTAGLLRGLGSSTPGVCVTTLSRQRRQDGDGLRGEEADGLGAAHAGVDELAVPELVHQERPDDVRVVGLGSLVTREQRADGVFAEVAAV